MIYKNIEGERMYSELGSKYPKNRLKINPAYTLGQHNDQTTARELENRNIKTRRMCIYVQYCLPPIQSLEQFLNLVTNNVTSNRK